MLFRGNWLRIKLAICIALLFSLVCFGITGPSQKIIVDNKKDYPIGEQYSILPDPSGKLTLEQVVDIFNQGKFQAPVKEVKLKPFKTYWLRFELANSCSGELMWMLHLNAQVSHIWLFPFFETEGQLQPSMPDTSVSVMYVSENRIMLPLHYNTRNVYYIKLYNQQGLETGLNHMYLSPSKGYRHYWLTHGLWIGLVIGGVFVMMLYGLFSFITVRQSLYLYYFLYTFFVELFLIALTFIGEQYIFKSNPWLCFKCCTLLLIAFMFYFPFIRKMVINEQNAWIDRWFFRPFIFIMLINSTVLSIVAFIKESWFAYFYDSSLFFYSAFSLLMVLLLWRTNKKIGRIILSGMAIMVTGGSLTIALWISDTVEENHFFNIGVYIELILFTYATILLKTEIEKDNQKKEMALADSRNTIENNQRELTQKALHLAQQEEILENLKNKLLEIKGEKTQTNELVLNVLSDVDSYLKQNSWEEFEHYFIEVHPEFYRFLKQAYPELSQMELRVCAMLRLNLNTKQMAAIMHKTPKSIDVMRTRIRQKLKLTRDENLFDKISIL